MKCQPFKMSQSFSLYLYLWAPTYLVAREQSSVTKQISYLPPPLDKRRSFISFSALSEQAHATAHAVSLRCDGVTSSVTVIPEHSLFCSVRERWVTPPHPAPVLSQEEYEKKNTWQDRQMTSGEKHMPLEENHAHIFANRLASWIN